MKIAEAPGVVEYYNKVVKDIFYSGRKIPEIQYSSKRTKWHLSDVTALCLLKPYYHRVLKNPPKPSSDSCWRFLDGRNFERSIARELPPVTLDGIAGTVDDKITVNGEEGLVEIKWTKDTCEVNPWATHEDWVRRMMGYCQMYNTNWMWLFVQFVAGNLMGYAPWIGGFKNPPKYIPPVRKAWRFEFYNKELEANWAEIVECKEMMSECVKNVTPPDLDYVAKTLPRNYKGQAWVCKDCEYRFVCELFEKENLEKRP